jgi:hypothetical protein
MAKDFPGEQWKNVHFHFHFESDYRLEISNFGRMRTFNKLSDGDFIKGSMVNGYKIIRLKFFSPRDEKVQKRFDYLKEQNFKLARKLKAQIENKEPKATIKETAELLESLKKKLSLKYKQELNSRVIHYHALVHRLVAMHFLKKPKADQILVSHLDHEKLNNRVTNLKWMSVQENSAHQQMSPYVIKEKAGRQEKRSLQNLTKLTVTKVMLLKKLLNQQKPMKQLVKQFKVTETQIYRIKRGENWGDIPAAT